MNIEQKLDQQLNIMTNYLLNGHEIEYSECIQHWYRKHYQCQNVPKPTDTDTLRLAVKASIIERLVEVLNSPPRSGHQTIPTWCREIKGLKKPFKLQSARLLEDEQLCEAFEKRNLQVVKKIMYLFYLGLVNTTGFEDKIDILKESIKYRNFSPYVDDETFTKRFNRIWKEAFGVKPPSR